MAQPSPWYGKVVREGRIHGKVSATGWGDSAATLLSGSSANETRHDVLPDAIFFSTLAALGGRTQCVIKVSCSRETVTAARAPGRPRRVPATAPGSARAQAGARPTERGGSPQARDAGRCKLKVAGRQNGEPQVSASGQFARSYALGSFVFVRLYRRL